MKDENLTLTATGTCFDDVNFKVMSLVIEDKGRFLTDEWRIVHGICHFECGRAYAHAWLENAWKNEAWTCYFASGVSPHGEDGHRAWAVTTIEEMHKEYRVTDFTRYTLLEAYNVERRARTYPPYEERYRNLCKDIRKD